MKSFEVGIEFRVGGDVNCVVDGFKGLFARRYIPTFEFVSTNTYCRCSAVIEWGISRSGFRLVSKLLSRDLDTYVVESQPPAPYVNESPYFFILQVLSRLYVKAGYLLLTDSVTFTKDGKETVLLLGYPHTGKSTLLALALANDYIPLTTENTLLEVRGGEVRVIGGTDVLVYDPEIEGIYDVKVPYHDITKHGYRIYDLGTLKERVKALSNKPKVSTIYLLYCSFNSRGCSYRIVKGRKATKTLWHFATSIIRGDDYYEPTPMNLSDEFTDSIISQTIKEVAKEYSSRFYEVFGSHKEVFNSIVNKAFK